MNSARSQVDWQVRGRDHVQRSPANRLMKCPRALNKDTLKTQTKDEAR